MLGATSLTRASLVLSTTASAAWSGPQAPGRACAVAPAAGPEPRNRAALGSPRVARRCARPTFARRRAPLGRGLRSGGAAPATRLASWCGPLPDHRPGPRTAWAPSVEQQFELDALTLDYHSPRLN